MYPNKEILVFHVESALHAGAGASVGHIDNPLQRERATGNPIVQANGVKGALREFFEEAQKARDLPRIEATFGSSNGNDGSGAVAFGEARLLFFPVRSLVGVFAYITCPSVIARFQRDLIACGKSPILLDDPASEKGPVLWDPRRVKRGKYLSGKDCMVRISSDNRLVIEEVPFERMEHGTIEDCLKTLGKELFPAAGEYDHFRSRFSERAVVLDDADYMYFVKYSTEVEPHNRIDEKGTVDENTGVWYTEYLPAESILYAPLFIGKQRIQNSVAMTAEEVNKFISRMEGRRSWLGGDRTTGKGRVMMHLYGNETSSTPAQQKSEISSSAVNAHAVDASPSVSTAVGEARGTRSMRGAQNISTVRYQW